MSRESKPPADRPKTRKPPAEWKKTARLKAIKDIVPDFIGKHELARHLRCHIGTIDQWIYEGTIPPPWCRPGVKHPLWLRRHYEVFKETRKWPEQAFWNRRATGERGGV